MNKEKTRKFKVSLKRRTSQIKSNLPLVKTTRPLRLVLEKALRNSLNSLDRTRLDQRLQEVEELKTETGDEFRERLRARADKRMARFLQHATSRATSSSMVTGVFGVPGQLVDIPIFYIQAFKNIGEVALLFGFDPREEDEQHFMLGVLRVAHTVGAQRRKAGVELLLHRRRPRERDLLAGALLAASSRLGVQGLKRFLSGGLRALNPLVGGVLNAHSNAVLMEAIVKTAHIAYIERLSLQAPHPQDR